MPKPKLPLPKPKPFVAPQPSTQMPWAGQRGTLEDLGSFGISPEDFFGGGGRIMFSDTAPKPALIPKQGAYARGFIKRAAEYGIDAARASELLKKANPYSPTRNLDTTILQQNRPAMVDTRAFDNKVTLDRNYRDAFSRSNAKRELSSLFPSRAEQVLAPDANKLMSQFTPPGVNRYAFSSSINLNPR